MARQIKIKDIARMAGVSSGTVDRVLHKRGNVSQSSREAVEKVLAEVDYKYNIHASAISFRKEFRIAITIPKVAPGEYWEAIKDGFDHALDEFYDIQLNCCFHYYDQFNPHSCAEAFNEVISSKPDGVIIGPTFKEETASLCSGLDSSGIPYIYVDSEIADTNPLATFTTDQHTCGVLAAKLLHMSIPADGEVAIFGVDRLGNKASSNSLAREEGFRAFMETIGQEHKIRHSSYTVQSQEETRQRTISFLQEYPKVKGISVLNSRGYLIAGILRELGRDDIKLVSFDLTEKNISELRNGYITALLCQRPDGQGFNAIKAMINYLLYKDRKAETRCMMPIDVVFKENLPYYKEIIKD